MKWLWTEWVIVNKWSVCGQYVVSMWSVCGQYVVSVMFWQLGTEIVTSESPMQLEIKLW